MDFFVDHNINLLRESPFSIYLGNGYVRTDAKVYQCYYYSESINLRMIAERYNQLCGVEKFGLCLNVGHANLLGKNLRVFAEDAGDLLKLIHMNDNDR